MLPNGSCVKAECHEKAAGGEPSERSGASGEERNQEGVSGRPEEEETGTKSHVMTSSVAKRDGSGWRLTKFILLQQLVGI